MMQKQDSPTTAKSNVADLHVWRFSVDDGDVRYGDRQRRKITRNGCNEPFKGRYWCPKLKWFRRDVCPFACRRECENFEAMCGAL